MQFHFCPFNFLIISAAIPVNNFLISQFRLGRFILEIFPRKEFLIRGCRRDDDARGME